VPEELPLERARELFADLLPSRGQVCAVSRFAEGTTTGAYRVEFASPDAKPIVLKVYKTGNLWSAAKEARALSFLAEHGIDVSPRVLAFSKAADALCGRPCVASSLRPGRTLEALDPGLGPEQRYEVYRQLGHVLKRLHAVPATGFGYVNGEIRDPLPDNPAHMARLFNYHLREFRRFSTDSALTDELEAHVAERAPAFEECWQPSYCHGDVHEQNLLAEIAEDGTCSLTGLLDPLNMHAADPLMDFVRLDSISMKGDTTKIAGLLDGYGVPASDRQPGAWPEAWRARLHLYRIALAFEIYNCFTICGATSHLPTLARMLRELADESGESGSAYKRTRAPTRTRLLYKKSTRRNVLWSCVPWQVAALLNRRS
jgi:aminoglycoside phosphotransferase (APT) family kinase protein